MFNKKGGFRVNRVAVSSSKRPKFSRLLVMTLIAATSCSVLVVIGAAIVLGLGGSELSATTNAPLPSTDQIVAEKAEQERLNTVQVLVPRYTIKRDEQLNPTMFDLIRMPRAQVPNGAVTSFESLRGKYATRQLSSRSPLKADDIAAQRSLTDILAKVPEGQRAIAIQVTATSSVEGWARAGAVVDVAWIMSIDGQQSVKVIVRGAKVLSAERSLDPDAQSSEAIPTSVTLLVSGEDAQKIGLASAAGSLVLHLRGDDDQAQTQVEESKRLTLKQLMHPEAQERSDDDPQGALWLKNNEGKFERWVITPNQGIRRER